MPQFKPTGKSNPTPGGTPALPMYNPNLSVSHGVSHTVYEKRQRKFVQKPSQTADKRNTDPYSALLFFFGGSHTSGSSSDTGFSPHRNPCSSSRYSPKPGGSAKRSLMRANTSGLSKSNMASGVVLAAAAAAGAGAAKVVLLLPAPAGAGAGTAERGAETGDISAAGGGGQGATRSGVVPGEWEDAPSSGDEKSRGGEGEADRANDEPRLSPASLGTGAGAWAARKLVLSPPVAGARATTGPTTMMLLPPARAGAATEGGEGAGAPAGGGARLGPAAAGAAQQTTPGPQGQEKLCPAAAGGKGAAGDGAAAAAAGAAASLSAFLALAWSLAKRSISQSLWPLGPSGENVSPPSSSGVPTKLTDGPATCG